MFVTSNHLIHATDYNVKPTEQPKTDASTTKGIDTEQPKTDASTTKGIQTKDTYIYQH